MDYEENLKRIEARQRDFARCNRARKAIFRACFKHYHRLSVTGLENIPPGAALLAANHSGGFDLDIVSLTHCAALSDRQVHPLIAEQWRFMNFEMGPLPGGRRHPALDPGREQAVIY